MNRLRHLLRYTVRREGADYYLQLFLLSFAATVILTRLFLSLTGYPQIGNSTLHIAHVLWGGLGLFISTVLTLIVANRWAYSVSAIIGGIGVGLFIDEVGKFITQTNDYFFPPAAPIIYAVFLLTVLVYLRVRRPHLRTPRAELFAALDGLEEVLEHDLDPRERADLERRLQRISTHPDATPSEARLAKELLEFLDCHELELVDEPAPFWQPARDRFAAWERRYLGKTRYRRLLALGLAGVAFALLWVVVFVSFGVQGDQSVVDAIARVPGVAPNVLSYWLLVTVWIALQGIAGVILLLAALLLIRRQDGPGLILGYIGLIFTLTVVGVLSFYFHQFAAIAATLYQFTLLLALNYYRGQYLPIPDPRLPARPAGPSL